MFDLELQVMIHVLGRRPSHPLNLLKRLTQTNKLVLEDEPSCAKTQMGEGGGRNQITTARRAGGDVKLNINLIVLVN